MAKPGDGWQHFSRRMLSSSICQAARAVLLSSASLCAGCGATGLAWVDEAHLESARQQRVSADRVANSQGELLGSIPATVEPGPSELRPRLNRTVTLGEIDAVATRSDAGPVTTPGTSVNVYNYNQVNVTTPAFGYANYAYGRTSSGFSPGRITVNPPPSNTSGPLPGQNWPAVADHGPSFPYASAPASPWTRTR
jgi:hypothetical protein